MIFIVIKDSPHFLILSLLTSVLAIRSFSMTKNKFFISENLNFFSFHDLNYCSNVLKKNKIVKKYSWKNYMYDWKDDFKFSSRIINTHLVAFLVLFYFFINWIYYGIYLVRIIVGLVEDQFLFWTNLLDLKLSFDFKKLFKVENVLTVFILSTVLSYFISLYQLFLGLRSIQKNLLKLYKGKKHNMALITKNTSVSNGNTHFAGFLVGYLLNGYIFIFIFIFLVQIVVYILVQLLSWIKIKQFFVQSIPFISVFAIKFMFNLICSKYLFLQQRGKVLALDNFRAYSIFIYITFFFDCFIGTMNALIRLFVGLLGSIFFTHGTY